MIEDNRTVEELLKSLRQTVEKRAAMNNANAAGDEKILDLRNPVSRSSFSGGSEDAVIKFVQDAVENSVSRIIGQNPRVVEDSLLKFLSTSESMRNLFGDICLEYLESKHFEELLRDIIEKKIASLLK